MKQKIDSSIIEIDTQSGLTILNLHNVVAITKSDYTPSVDIHMDSGTVFTVTDDEYAVLAQAWMIVTRGD